MFIVHTDQTTQNVGLDTTIMHQAMRRNTSNVDRSEKGKDIVRYGAQSNSGPASSKVGYGSRVMFC